MTFLYKSNDELDDNDDEFRTEKMLCVTLSTHQKKIFFGMKRKVKEGTSLYLYVIDNPIG